jgi:predicted  nucleic acid-binding Zn-ribbon protein
VGSAQAASIDKYEAMRVAMSKEKDAFKQAMADLQDSVLDAEQREALAVMDRYAGELRRQAADLKAEVARLQGSLAAAEEKIVGLQKVAQEVPPLEERLRAADNRVEILEGQVRSMRGQLLEAIPNTTETRQAARTLTTHVLREMADAFKGWEADKANVAAYNFASSLLISVCQHMGGQNQVDKQLDEDVFAACHRFLHRVAPGRFHKAT